MFVQVLLLVETTLFEKGTFVYVQQFSVLVVYHEQVCMELVLLMLLLGFIIIFPLSLLQYYNLMTSCLSYDIACNTGSGSTTRECSAKRAGAGFVLSLSPLSAKNEDIIKDDKNENDKECVLLGQELLAKSNSKPDAVDKCQTQ